MRFVAVLAISLAAAGCSTTSPGTEFGDALVGEWESSGCKRKGADCTVWTFSSDGQFTYDFETDDYEDSHSTKWSVEPITESIGRVSLEGAGVHFAVIDEQGLSIQGEGTAYVKVASGGGSSGGLEPVDPGPLGQAMIGTWLRQQSSAPDTVNHPERITLDASGDFEARYGDAACSGIWTFGVGGNLGKSRSEPNEGWLTLNSGDVCNNEDGEERLAWARIDSFSVISSDESLVLDGVEYRR